jgi:hypothetical protein
MQRKNWFDDHKQTNLVIVVHAQNRAIHWQHASHVEDIFGPMFHLAVYSEFELESFFVRNQLCFSVRCVDLHRFVCVPDGATIPSASGANYRHV